MKTRHKRALLIVSGLAVLGLIAALILNAFESNLVFFFSPTQVAAGEAPKGKAFRVGGLVGEKSIRREADGVTINFVIRHFNHIFCDILILTSIGFKSVNNITQFIIFH